MPNAAPMLLRGCKIHRLADERFDHNCDVLVVTLGGTSKRVASPGLVSVERPVDPTGPIQVPLRREAIASAGSFACCPGDQAG